VEIIKETLPQQSGFKQSGSNHLIPCIILGLLKENTWWNHRTVKPMSTPVRPLTLKPGFSMQIVFGSIW
jgi:hypothetical protein